MWVCSMTLEYVNYIMWAPRTNWEYSLTIHTFKLNWDMGWSYTLGTMHKKYSSSHEYSYETMSSQCYSLKLLANNIHRNENTNIVHKILTIQTYILHYLC